MLKNTQECTRKTEKIHIGDEEYTPRYSTICIITRLCQYANTHQQRHTCTLEFVFQRGKHGNLTTNCKPKCTVRNFEKLIYQRSSSWQSNSNQQRRRSTTLQATKTTTKKNIQGGMTSKCNQHEVNTNAKWKLKTERPERSPKIPLLLSPQLRPTISTRLQISAVKLSQAAAGKLPPQACNSLWYPETIEWQSRSQISDGSQDRSVQHGAAIVQW